MNSTLSLLGPTPARPNENPIAKTIGNRRANPRAKRSRMNILVSLAAIRRLWRSIVDTAVNPPA